jgi:hypothetical protein
MIDLHPPFSVEMPSCDTRAFDGFAAEVSKTLQSWGHERFDYLVNNAALRWLQLS